MKNKIFLMVIIFLIGLISNVYPQTPFRSGILLHHSSGGVIWNNSNPNVPQLMDIYNTEHNYSGNNAVTMDIGVGFFPPIREFSDNYWDTWHAVFVGQSPYPEDVLALQQYIQNNSIVVIKSCFGGTDPLSMGDPADTLIIEDYYEGRTYYRTQWHWRSIIRAMQSYPDNFFVIWTGIPLVPGGGFNGTLAHNFCIWAKDTLSTGNDPTFGDFPDNVYVFDSFHLLAIPPIWGMNPLYHDPGDNHPNPTGCNVVAQPFVWETFDAAIAYEGITPVELILFNGNYEDGVVKLTWITATESNNFGFEVERGNDYSAFESIGFVNGNGTSTNRIIYTFVDDNLFSNRYYYRLKQIDLDGTFEYSDEVMIEIDGLGDFQLFQNYPNPFNPSTEINFTLAKSGNVTLKVYNNLGKVVATLANGFMRSGKHSVKFNAKDFTSGVYFYRIEGDNFTSTRKMLLIK